MRKWIHKLSLKKRFSILAIIVLLLIPSVMTWIYVYSVDAKNKAVDVLSVTLYDSEERQIVSEEGYAKDASLKSLLGIFYSIAQSKNTLEQVPPNHEEASFIRADLTLNGVRSEWRCYFSLEDNDRGYCVDTNGLVYAIDPTVNKNFLGLPYAESLYLFATPPSLLTIDNDSVIPKQMEWYYKNNSDDFVSAESLETTANNLTYRMTGEFGFDFDISPTECEVTIKQGSTVLFTGFYEDIPSLTTDPENNVLHVSVRAEWERVTAEEGYGSAKYEFLAQIDTPALFAIHKNSVTPGDIVVISCANVSDRSKIQFSFPPNVNLSTPLFHQDGDFTRAILVIPESFEVGKITFDITYGASVQTFTLNILPKVQTTTYSLSLTQKKTELAQELDKLIYELLGTLPSASGKPSYFRGNFLDPKDEGLTVGYSHGSELLLNGEEASSASAVGTEFLTSGASGIGVHALNNGIVTAVGQNDWLGKYVIIDHGLGLYSWYAHLGRISVEQGDVLKTGDTLGITGTGGISEGDGVLILFSLHGHLINPDHILGKELPLELFEEALQKQETQAKQ